MFINVQAALSLNAGTLDLERWLLKPYRLFTATLKDF